MPFRDLWAEPAPDADDRSWLDGALIVLLMALGLLDGLLSGDVGWPWVAIPLMVITPIVLFWRRSSTLLVAIVVFSVYSVLHGAMLLAGVTSTTLNVALIGVTVYTLARWASGREALIGLAIATVGTALAGSTGLLREAFGAVGLSSVVASFVLAGVAVRLWSSRGLTRLSEAKMAERNRIARELHDTVAHRVSAIAIQAQGGQEMLATNPAAAGNALTIIEQQASLTLSEMRLILGVLRDHDPTDLSPNAGIADVAGLADTSTDDLDVTVTMSGDLDDISSSVESAVFRLAQEAVTNARRHGSGATRVEVDVVGSRSHVELTVRDDGSPNLQVNPGYGLLGMAERASLLGGRCEAGPSRSGGWIVEASLPRNGRSS